MPKRMLGFFQVQRQLTISTTTMQKLNQIRLHQPAVSGFLLRCAVCVMGAGFLFLSSCAGMRFSGGQTSPAEVDAATTYSDGVRFFPDMPVGINLRHHQTNFAESYLKIHE